MGGRAWHGSPYNTEEEPEDPDWKSKRPLLQHQEVPTLEGLAEKAALIAAMRELLKNSQRDFGKSYVPVGYPAPFPITAAVMLAELGITQSRLQSGGRSLQPQPAVASPRGEPQRVGPESWSEQYGEIIEWGVKTTALITAGAIMYQAGQKMPTRGYHYKAPNWSPLSSNWPLWKIGIDNAMLIEMAIKTGQGPLELVDELGYGRANGLWNQNAWADPGLG